MIFEETPPVFLKKKKTPVLGKISFLKEIPTRFLNRKTIAHRLLSTAENGASESSGEKNVEISLETLGSRVVHR